jgi:AcrR family transcriptional regulator
VYTYDHVKSPIIYIALKQALASAPPKRARNAAATRDAILHSALAAFSLHGYDGIGVREIAQTAGVTGVLVNRYFGSKEKLFSAVVELAFADNNLFQGDHALLAHRLASWVVTRTKKGVEPGDSFLLLLRSAPNPRAAEILRDSIARHFERPLKASLHGPRASERAAVMLALTAGLQLIRKVIGSKALADADNASLFDDLAAMFQRLIDRPAPRPRPSPVLRGRIKNGDS